MAVIGGFLGGGVEMTPAGYGTVILQWNTWDGSNISGAVFTLTPSGGTAQTVSGNDTGYAAIQVSTGTYTIEVSHTGDYQGDGAKQLIVESTQSYYVQFYGASAGNTIVAGTGISVTGSGTEKTVSLATVGSAGSVGSATRIPIITTDAYGRVTSKSYATVYPPTSAGSAGQVWTSDGSGAGYWTTPSRTPISNFAAQAVQQTYVPISWNVDYPDDLDGVTGTMYIWGTCTSSNSTTSNSKGDSGNGHYTYSMSTSEIKSGTLSTQMMYGYSSFTRLSKTVQMELSSGHVFSSYISYP